MKALLRVRQWTPLALACGLAAGAAAREREPERPPAAPLAAEATQADSIVYKAIVANGNLMGVTVTNYGFIGNNFSTRSPSMEYPLGSGFEHLVRGGLWVSALAQDDVGEFLGVVTGALDGSAGGGAQNATEFTPAGNGILIRSKLSTSPHYFPSPPAVSEQDLICEFSDRPARRSSNNSEDHRPTNILVRQENYSWSVSNYQHLLIYRYVIKNLGRTLRDVRVGLYAELASGPKNTYPTWPPSSGNSTIGGWFSKKWIEYDDSLRLLQEHYCFEGPTPDNCVLDRVPFWVGIKLLGTAPESISTKKVTLAAWNWSPGDTLRGTDSLRFAIMKADTIQSLEASDLQPRTGDPVTLLGVGPFARILNGDSITVDFALVGGAGLEDTSRVNEHARFAQRAYDRGYKVPEAPESPRLKVVARDQALDLHWDDTPEFKPDSTGPLPLDFEGYRVYISQDRNNLLRVAQFDKTTVPHDTLGFNTGFAAVQFDTTIDNVRCRYRYRIPALKNGFKYFVAVTAYDLGNVETESLESGIQQNKALSVPSPRAGEKAPGKVYVYPNPYRVEAGWDRGRLVRDHYLWFTNLPARCALRIYTLAGDLIYETDFDGSTYRGEGARGVYNPSNELDVDPPTLSGSTFAWDMITRQGQAVATGLYLFSVEGSSGERTVGKFLIVKSDREGAQ